MRNKIILKFKEKKVFVEIGKDIIFNKDFFDFCRSISSSILIITDEKVKNLYGQNLLERLQENKNLSVFLFSIPSTSTEIGTSKKDKEKWTVYNKDTTSIESYKTRKTKEEIENYMFENKFSKTSLIISLGGGVISDISSFIAATYMRGIPLILLPTTLLSMIDSSIGGKAAINTSFGKNLIGTFYHPEKIFIDLSFLKTLKKEEFQDGFSEIIKHSLIKDKNLFNFLSKNHEMLSNLENKNSFENKNFLEDTHSDNLKKNLIYKNLLIKKKIVEKDEKDKNKRKVLNFGHTLAHAIEKNENFQNISHGKALVIGILFSSYLSFYLKFLKKKEFFKIIDLFEKFFKISSNTYFKTILKKLLNRKYLEDILKNIEFDKKASKEGLYFILLKKIGKIKTFKTSKLKLKFLKKEKQEKNIFYNLSSCKFLIKIEKPFLKKALIEFSKFFLNSKNHNVNKEAVES